MSFKAPVDAIAEDMIIQEAFMKTSAMQIIGFQYFYVICAASQFSTLGKMCEGVCKIK